jgi:hypothetical protein
VSLRAEGAAAEHFKGGVRPSARLTARRIGLDPGFQPTLLAIIDLIEANKNRCVKHYYFTFVSTFV